MVLPHRLKGFVSVTGLGLCRWCYHSSQSLPMTRHCLTRICQDRNQLLFKCCQGSQGVPGNKSVPVSPSRSLLPTANRKLPPQMSKPEQDLDVLGDCPQYTPSSLLLDPLLTLEDPLVKETADSLVDILSPGWMAGDGYRSQRSEILKRPLNHSLKVECLLQMRSQNCLLSAYNLFWEPYDYRGFEFSIISISTSHYLSPKGNSDYVVWAINIVKHKPNFGGGDQ